jgi:hypothetical protein
MTRLQALARRVRKPAPARPGDIAQVPSPRARTPGELAPGRPVTPRHARAHTAAADRDHAAPTLPRRASRTPRRLAAATAGALLAAALTTLAATATSRASSTGPASQAAARATAGPARHGTAATLASAATNGTHPANPRHTASTPAALAQPAGYRVQQLHSPAWAATRESQTTITVEVLDTAGDDISGPGIALTVTGLAPRPAPGTTPAAAFTPVNLGLRPCYQLTIDTAAYPAGTYTVSFTAGTDPARHTAVFTVP